MKIYYCDGLYIGSARIGGVMRFVQGTDRLNVIQRLLMIAYHAMDGE